MKFECFCDIMTAVIAMKEKQIFGFSILPGDDNSFWFEQREELMAHTRFHTELAWLACILNGDAQQLDSCFGMDSSGDVNLGKLSDDPLRQSKYLAVSFMTIGCRAAILGGMREADAYNYSDVFIRSVDRMLSEDEVYFAMKKSMHELAHMVKAAKKGSGYPEAVRECINYIYDNLHSHLTLSLLASHCGFSPSYLSALFKTSTGMTVTQYVTREKLRAARSMLSTGKYNCTEVANYLNFCSQSYFCECFKKEFGITPTQCIV